MCGWIGKLLNAELCLAAGAWGSLVSNLNFGRRLHCDYSPRMDCSIRLLAGLAPLLALLLLSVAQNTSLPVVDLGYELQQASSFNASSSINIKFVMSNL